MLEIAGDLYSNHSEIRMDLAYINGESISKPAKSHTGIDEI